MIKMLWSWGQIIRRKVGRPGCRNSQASREKHSMGLLELFRKSVPITIKKTWRVSSILWMILQIYSTESHDLISIWRTAKIYKSVAFTGSLEMAFQIYTHNPTQPRAHVFARINPLRTDFASSLKFQQVHNGETLSCAMQTHFNLAHQKLSLKRHHILRANYFAGRFFMHNKPSTCCCKSESTPHNGPSENWNHILENFMLLMIFITSTELVNIDGMVCNIRWNYFKASTQHMSHGIH